MGLPIEKDWMDTILNLSKDDKIELIALISDSMLTSRRYGDVTPAANLSASERLQVLRGLYGAWKDDTPDDLADFIVNSRTISTREITLDD
jgi:hypothetical protein